MGIFDSLKKAAQTFIEEQNTPESFKKGQKFEEFIRKVIFPNEKYKILKKTHDYNQNSKDYVMESLEPDYKFECLDSKKQFYVEAKFRSWFYKGKIELFKDSQFKRLKELNSKESVFVIIGIGYEPDNPNHICLVPMNKIKSPSLTDKFLEDYIIANNMYISPNKLWSLIGNDNSKVTKIQSNSSNKNKINESGHCIRCNSSLKTDINHPFCKTCFNEWNKYKNPNYIEKYCHFCGESNKVTFEKPICYNCYKNQ